MTFDSLLHKFSNLNLFFGFSVIIGSFIGSFLNVVILRLPEGTFLKHSRSVCPGCQKMIPIWLNIPVFGWIFLRGKARCCGMKISVQYPIVEFLTALMFGLSFMLFPYMSFNSTQYTFDLNQLIRFIHASLFVSIMIVCSLIDIKLMIIPDKISIPMILLSPLVATFHPDLSMQSSLIGVLLGGGFLYFVAWLYWIIRKEYGMGFGDVKLLAGIGGWLGYESLFQTVFIGSIIGSIIGILALAIGRQFSWQAKLPFGPFLATGATIWLFRNFF